MIDFSRRGMLAGGGALAAGALMPFAGRAAATDYARLTTAPPRAAEWPSMNFVVE